MINLSTFREIKKRKIAGQNQAEVEKELGLSHYAVSKHWRMSEAAYIEEVGCTAQENLEKYRPYIMELMRGYPNMTNAAIRDRMVEQFSDYKGTRPSWYRYMKNIREIEGLKKEPKKRNYSAIETQKPGYEAQADMGQYKMRDMYGNTVHVYFFCMVMSYSRQKYFYLQTDPFSIGDFVSAHDRAFRYFGGRPEVIVYDQDKMMVVSENAGKIILARVFDAYRKKAGFKVILCNMSDPESKGKVETMVKYIKINFLNTRQYCGIDSLNSAALAWLDREGNGKINATTLKAPKELFAEEVKALKPYAPINMTNRKQMIRRVSHVNTVTYHNNRYAVPKGILNSGDKVRLEVIDDDLEIYEDDTNNLIAKHKVAKELGTLSRVSEPKVEHTSLITDTINTLGGSTKILQFIEEIKKDKPRYIRQQCYMLRKLVKDYPEEAVMNTIHNCMDEQQYCATEVLARLIKYYGLPKSPNIIPSGSKKYYKEKAKEYSLQKYSRLAGGGKNVKHK